MAKIPKKFRGKAEKAVLSKFHITGSLLQGYTVVERASGDEIKTYVNMWDAIDHKKRLNEPS